MRPPLDQLEATEERRPKRRRGYLTHAAANPDGVPRKRYRSQFGDWLSSRMTIPPGATAWEPPGGKGAPQPLFLPLALCEEPCVPEKQRVDVALVIDASTSMDEQTRPGWSKLDAAREAVGVLLGDLRLDAGDQATIVVFNARPKPRLKAVAL